VDKLVESAASQVGNLVGQIRAGTTRLEAHIQDSPEPVRSLAQQTIEQQKPLLNNEFIELIAREDSAYSKSQDRLLISTRRAEWVVWAKNQIEILQKLNNAMKYDRRDYAIIANNVYLQLCSLGDGWYDIRPLAEQLRAYTNADDVAYIAETVLVSMQYIIRDPQNRNIRLTSVGREHCSRGIEIPPSDIQLQRRLLGMP
jgi:hypothetical protein